MKLSISLLWFGCSSISTISAFSPLKLRHKPRPISDDFSSTRLFYDIQRDPPNENVWSVLTTTEKWIASTLQDAQKASLDGNGNPLSRKEVSYVCETSQDPAMILANIFRKLKEARQLGETHGQEQEEYYDEQWHAMQNDPKSKSKTPEEIHRATLRQTQVLVIPANEDLTNNFAVFDNLINAINNARRNARDYVTDVSLDKLDERMYGDGDRDWIVSVNCAHLHPKFGEKTPEQELKELQEEEEQGEVDINLQEYKERRLQARRSPYPSVVVEVRAMPPPEFTPPPPSGPETPKDVMEDDKPISSEFIQQLEALFSKSTLQKDTFYESIGSHIESVSAVTPMSVAQHWIADNDPQFDATQCAFTTSDTAHVDEAYEFVFTNLAMQTTQFNTPDSIIDAGAQKRQYLVLPNFVTSSATSLEKFAMEVRNIINALPSVKGKVDVSCFHPEHIYENRRCPVPVFILQWND